MNVCIDTYKHLCYYSYMETKKRKNQKPIMMYIPESLFYELKSICDKQDTTMTRYVMKSIITRMNMEREERLKI